jgi:hypothetical protein
MEVYDDTDLASCSYFHIAQLRKNMPIDQKWILGKAIGSWIALMSNDHVAANGKENTKKFQLNH